MAFQAAAKAFLPLLPSGATAASTQQGLIACGLHADTVRTDTVRTDYTLMRTSHINVVERMVRCHLQSYHEEAYPLLYSLVATAHLELNEGFAELDSDPRCSGSNNHAEQHANFLDCPVDGDHPNKKEIVNRVLAILQLHLYCQTMTATTCVGSCVTSKTIITTA